MTKPDKNSNKGEMVEDPRPVARYIPNQMHHVVATAMRHMIEANVPIYQRGGQLVQVVRSDKVENSGGISRPAGALSVQPIRPHALNLHSIASTSWRRFDARSKAWQSSAPPLDLAHYILSQGEWRFRVLTGIIEAPTIRRDGTVLDREGYDPATGLLLDTNGAQFPPIPDKPTRADAMAALVLLREVVADFPFVPDRAGAPADAPSAARSVALSALLLTLVRRMMDKAPIHGFDATQKGTGKTLLCDAISHVATGREAAVMSFGATEEEFAKRLYSVLLTNDPVVVIDNVSRPIESEELNAVTTSPIWRARVLGQSHSPPVHTNTAMLVNGNALRFVGDLTVRTVMCMLDAGMERPEQRSGFAHPDLLAWIADNRGRIVAAALTLMRAHIVAGYPGITGLPSRFEQWDRIVRGALVWLGETDPWNTSAMVVGMDQERDQLAALMHAWADLPGTGVHVSSQHIVDLATMDENEALNDGIEAWTPEGSKALYRALSECLPLVNAKRLTGYLSRFKERIVAGRKIRMLPGDGKRGAVFWLEDVGKAPPPPNHDDDLDYDGY